MRSEITHRSATRSFRVRPHDVLALGDRAASACSMTADVTSWRRASAALRRRQRDGRRQLPDRSRGS